MELKIRVMPDRVHLEGYVNAVGRDSRIIEDASGTYVEQIQPGTFGKALARGARVETLLNHDNNRVLNDTNGTLQLKEDSIGLYASVDITDTEVIEKAKNNKLRGWSFGFYPLSCNEETRADGVLRRIVTDLELIEVSIIDDTAIPCYEGTSVAVRELAHATVLETRAIIEIVEQEGTNFAEYYRELNERINGGLSHMHDLKLFEEQKNEKIERMQSLVKAAEEEKRALTDEEKSEFDSLESEIKSLDETIERFERAGSMETVKKVVEPEAQAEEKAFESYVRAQLTGQEPQERANMTIGSNGAIIPTTIAKKIIQEVKDICPILARATVYHVKGELKIPVWGDDTGDNITVAFSDDFTELTAHAGKFISVDLKGHLAGALTLIGRRVANNAEIDVVAFVISEMARKIAEFLEDKLLNGAVGYNEGALATTNILTAASATAITADELIGLQAKVKQAYQKDACWIMNPETFVASKKLKDGNSRYLLQDDFTGEFSYRLLGKPVFLSDNMPAIATGNKAVLYGDLSGLSVNMREDIEIQVLREKYATQHAIGVVGWFEFDSKVSDNQKLAVLQMA